MPRPSNFLVQYKFMYMRHIGDKALSRDRLTSGDGSADGSPCRGGGERFVVLLSTGKAIVVMIWQLFFFHSRQNICLNQMSPLTKCDAVKWTNRSKSNDMKKDEDFFRIDVLSCTILGFFTARSLRAMANYFPTQLRGSSQVVRAENRTALMLKGQTRLCHAEGQKEDKLE